MEDRVSEDVEALERNADRIVKEIGIPPCPAILTKLLRETRSEEPDFRRVGQLIGGDVALASAVLKVANSPFYGLRTKASSVQQALALLGLRAVSHLVTGLLLRQAFSGAPGPSMERYWKSSMATSLISALLSRETGQGDSGIACTYGLFRDCGMPVMLQKYPIYADIFDGSAHTPGEPVLDVENDRYATNHARVGAQLAAFRVAVLRHPASSRRAVLGRRAGAGRGRRAQAHCRRPGRGTALLRRHRRGLQRMDARRRMGIVRTRSVAREVRGHRGARQRVDQSPLNPVRPQSAPWHPVRRTRPARAAEKARKNASVLRFGRRRSNNNVPKAAMPPRQRADACCGLTNGRCT